MAYVKIIPIRTRLDRSINYVLNANKTGLSKALGYILDKDKTTDNHVVYESAINCHKKNAYSDMMNTKRRHNKTGGVLGYHIIHSYKPDEVTPELAHTVGMEFAQKCFGDKYEVVIGTHVDKGHIHNHITINSVSFVDGKKYRNNFKDYYGDMRGISNEICSKHGLSVITPSEDKKAITYFEWLSKNKGKMSWQQLLRNDIDHAIATSFSYGNFLVLMEGMGYTFKQGKYLAFRPQGKDRFSRTYKLGDEYSESAIKRRISGKDLTEKPITKRHSYKEFQKNFSKSKKTGFIALCYHYLFLLKVIEKNEAPQRVSNLYKEDLIKFEAMKSIYNFIHDRNLDSVEDILSYKAKCDDTIALLNKDRSSYKQAHEKQSVLYAALMNYKNYRKAHELYSKGYENMLDESQLYLQAEKILAKGDVTTEEHMVALESEYSEYLDKMAKYRSDVRYFRKEKRMCDKASEFSSHAETQIKSIKYQLLENKQMKAEDKHK